MPNGLGWMRFVALSDHLPKIMTPGAVSWTEPRAHSVYPDPCGAVRSTQGGHALVYYVCLSVSVCVGTSTHAGVVVTTSATDHIMMDACTNMVMMAFL